MKKEMVFLIYLTGICLSAFAKQEGNFNGVNTNLGNLQKLSGAKSRSISPENFTGRKGQGGMAQLSDSIYPNKQMQHTRPGNWDRGGN